jgi:hypothetical protein
MTEQAGPDPLVEAAEGDYIDQRTEAAGGQPEAPEDGDAPLDATEADVQDQRTQA